MQTRSWGRVFWTFPCLVSLACHGPFLKPLPAPSALAQEGFSRARFLQGSGNSWRDRWQALETSAELEPEWAAPQRMWDDLRGSLLLGPQVLRGRWMAWRGGLEPNTQAYLIGRQLSGMAPGWFQRARDLNPRDPWGWHGMAFDAGREGRMRAALRYQEQAVSLAREPFELRYFSQALARLHVAGKRAEEAFGVLEAAMGRVEAGDNRRALVLQWIELAALSEEPEVHGRGEGLARQMLADPAILESERLALIRSNILDDGEVAALLLAPGDVGAAGLALRLLGAPARPILRALMEREGGPARDPSRVELFAAGEVLRALEDWFASQPKVLTEVRPEVLASWQELRGDCENWQERPEARSAAELCQSLLAVGWFAEAQAFARAMPEGLELDTALDVERRASSALVALERIRELMFALDKGEARVGGTEVQVASLEDLLGAVAGILQQAGWVDGPGAQAIVDSPLLGVGGVARVVHPGPVAAKWDGEYAPLGETIPGLAQALFALGRVGLFGAALGVPPDGTVLRLVGHETIQGEHLGVPFHGTLLWCDGVDVGGAAMRQGGSIAGAALHEGYYVDLAELRRTLESWTIWNRRWENEDLREPLLQALEDPGLPVEAVLELLGPGEADGDGVFRPQGSPWTSLDPLLRQSDRVRLAVLLERGQDGELGRVDFDEIVQVTGIHEEGHLCERSRFLPVHKNLGALLAFAARENFSPLKIQQALEYRAELTALCVVPEPRLVLVDMLDLAQQGGGLTPHAEAYRRLLKDLVLELGRRAEEGAGGWQPSREFLLVHQLHRLPPEELRAAALELARREGLVGR